MGSPSFVAVFSASWAVARAALESRARFYWIWIAAGAAVGALATLVPDSVLGQKPGSYAISAAIPAAMVAYVLMLVVLGYFVLADVVRRFVPGFQMTVQVFLIQFLIAWVYNAVVQFAAYFLLVPAFYLGPKLWLCVPNYLLVSNEKTDINEVIVRSWRDTDGLYWPTLGLALLSSVVVSAIVTAAIGLAFVAIQLFRPMAIVATPALLAITLYALAELYAVWVGWAVAVRAYADARPAPSSGTFAPPGV